MVIQSHLKQTYSPKRVDINGRRHYDCVMGVYPSITTVLGCRKSEWLDQWRANVGPEVADATSRKAAAIGTGLHSFAERYLLNEDISSDLKRALPDIRARFNNFRSFLQDVSEVFLLERGVYSTYLKVAGTVDCFAVYKGIPCVIDFKTANKPKAVEDIEGYFAQATFYAYAIAELYNVPVPDIVIAIAVNGVKEPQVFRSKPKKHLPYLIETIRMYNDEAE